MCEAHVNALRQEHNYEDGTQQDGTPLRTLRFDPT